MSSLPPPDGRWSASTSSTSTGGRGTKAGLSGIASRLGLLLLGRFRRGGAGALGDAGCGCLPRFRARAPSRCRGVSRGVVDGVVRAVEAEACEHENVERRERSELAEEAGVSSDGLGIEELDRLARAEGLPAAFGVYENRLSTF